MAMVETRTRAFACPAKYFQGIGEFDLLESYTSIYGKKAFYTIDGFLYDDLKKRLDKFGGECSYNEVDRTIEKFQQSQADVLVGAGGGKTLDTAKAAADKMGVPVIVVPTSASCDAPCSAMSVMYTDTGEYIHNIRHKKNPEIVLVDTGIVSKAPVRLPGVLQP